LPWEHGNQASGCEAGASSQSTHSIWDSQLPFGRSGVKW